MARMAAGDQGNRRYPFCSLPEFLDFIFFGKTILEINRKFGLFMASPLRKRVWLDGFFLGVLVGSNHSP